MPKVKLFDEKLILEKAMELFWKKGFHATSIRDLVNFLGISRSSIYDTYGGKNELFYKAFHLYRTTNITGFSNFLNQQKNIKKGLRKLFEMAIEQSIADMDKKGCFVVNTTTELVPGDIEIQKILKENENTFVNIFYEFLLKGEQSGEIPKGKNLKSIANLYYTLYNGIKVVSKVQPNSKELLSSVDTVLTLLD
ncbi:MAG TPA: TetR/AcrR family transcriptional regulator [Flavobacteriaceae bacterium]|jgi:TetR/AcrR family transcriptional repressor of nem operon|nr:TetR/AcrR family transcriptional regulator [Flavobacteriaceae bacterium]